MDDLNVFFAFLRFPMTHAFPSISHIRSVFYAVESCSTFNGLSIANADKKCQADVFFRAGLLTSHCFLLAYGALILECVRFLRACRRAKTLHTLKKKARLRARPGEEALYLRV